MKYTDYESVMDSFDVSLNSDVDPFIEARNAFLKNKFNNCKDFVIKEVKLTFSIGNTAKNAPLVFFVLESFPQELYYISKNTITIRLDSEKELLEYGGMVSSLLTIIKTWSSVELFVNDVGIGLTTEFRFLLNYVYEKNRVIRGSYGCTLEQLKYSFKGKRSISKERNVDLVAIKISREKMFDSLKDVVGKYVELYGHNKEVKRYEISKTDIVIMIENSLIIAFRLVPVYWRALNDENVRKWDFPYIYIQELTHNDLFRFNFAGFKRCFECDYIGLEFFSFHGLDYYVKPIDCFETVNHALPELRLEKRYYDYPGETHHFIILRMERVDGRIIYGVGDTKRKTRDFILKLCKELEEKNSRSLELNGASCLPFVDNQDFISAFLSWKGEKKRWRLENKFSYYIEDRQVKNDADLFKIPRQIVGDAYSGKYDKCEFGSYSKPLNRWKSEELVYNITKKLYKEYQVIYQYKPFYLSTDKGHMSYDIYICGLKIAIEYQGKQHFEPVDYFGGEESFQTQRQRDQMKSERSRENGVKLVYVNYWEDITPELIKNKIEEARKNI